MFRFALLALGFALLALPVAAQETGKAEPGKADSARSDPDIIINGRLDAQIESLVRRLAPARNDRQIARWDDRFPLCTVVAGLWPEREAYLSDRIAAVARTIGIKVAAKPKCDVNNVIVFTTDADKFAAALVDRHPKLIQNVDTFGLPHGKLKASYLAPRAVRWFSVRETGAADGSPNTIGASLSRVKLHTRENTLMSLIVIDEPKMAGIKWSQLGDYLAMVCLGQPQMDADYGGEDSVLAIFADRDTGRTVPAGLTAQDRSFLAALYVSDASADSSRQREEIARGIRKDMRGTGK